MKIYNSKSKIINGVMTALLMTGASLVCFIFMGVMGKVIGTLGILFSGAAILSQLVQLFANGPQVIIDEIGIEDSRLKIGPFKWEEIETISIEQTNNIKWINVHLIDPQPYYNRLSRYQLLLRKANGQIGINDFRIRFINLATSIDDAWNTIEEHMKKHQEPEERI